MRYSRKERKCEGVQTDNSSEEREKKRPKTEVQVDSRGNIINSLIHEETKPESSSIAGKKRRYASSQASIMLPVLENRTKVNTDARSLEIQPPCPPQIVKFQCFVKMV